MLKTLLNKLVGDYNEKELKKIRPRVEKINALYEEYKKNLTKDEDFTAKTEGFKKRLKEGETMDDILEEAFATVKAACNTLLGRKWEVRGDETKWDMVPYDVQLVGGVILHQGRIAEMKTGEGKTLVCTLAVYLNALEGKGVWVVTVNEYLAHRDAEWMGGLYNFLGLSVGIVKHGQSKEDKKAAYQADITYGTNNEYGFDYLRDNMAINEEDLVQRDLNYAIVDEVDSILVDEARTPLIISAPAAESTSKYQRYSGLISQLKENEHYNIDEKMKTAVLTDAGIKKMEELLGMDNIYEEGGYQEVHHIEQALKSQACFKKDTDYVVKDGQVTIVDEFTGRLMPGRRYSDGLHQAIEAKEGVEIKRESRTLATITFQNLFRMFKKLAGMTGTAKTEEEEFGKIYGLDVMVIPTNKPCVRIDKNDSIYKTQKGKFMAVAKKVKELHAKGQPVLVGTVSVQRSETMSQLLKMQGVKHNVLNAKHHEKEAEIVKDAGQKKTVTIATNMAGRGTDIKLGDGVKELGGLHIIGTERHESRRIDNQLRGRSGRQGDPGETQFFVSMEDDLMRMFGSEKIQRMMTILKVPDDMPIENRMISNAIESAQKKVEGHHFDIRKHLVEYDDVINKQREIIYRIRRKILKGENVKNEILLLVEHEVEGIVHLHAQDKDSALWDYKEIHEILDAIHKDPVYPIALQDLEKITDKEKFIDTIKNYLYKEYEEREKILESAEMMREMERAVYLRTIDVHWMEHIDNMSSLREAVSLSGYAQKDPLIVYKEEGFAMFEKMLAQIQSSTVNTLFKIDIVQAAPKEVREAPEQKNLQTNEDAIESPLSGDRKPPSNSNPVIIKAGAGGAGASAGAGAGGASGEKVGRNEPCPCGSGKKYKKCCGR
ncbi:MAG: preprotein translocase subunit SecA [Patescibacteria group bacterium]|nr:preprotein translocase subunit SecA [Patescibacteria group bacterium]